MQTQTNRPNKILVVDDGSRDRTIAEAEEAVRLSGGELPLTVLKHEVNMGLGAGLRTGIYFAMASAGMTPRLAGGG